MTTAVVTQDSTELSAQVRRIVILGLIEGLFVLLIGLVSKYLDGPVETVLLAVLLLIGLGLLTVLPGLWTRPTTVEGIAGAAGIGLGATVVFLILDVIIFQNIGLYTNRWLAIGGGSNWWYHPVWWMVGTFIPFMGAFALANQTARRGGPSAAGVILTAVVLALVIGALAAVFHFPGAVWSVATFGVAFLPALALTVLGTGIGARRA
jgi:hypothetical protein